VSTPATGSRRRAWIAPLTAVALVLLIVAGLSWYELNALFTGPCGSTEIARLSSPDGRRDAVMFEHNCGATTDLATHVSVLPAGAVLGNAAGNAFVAEADGDGTRAPWGGPPVELTWKGNTNLMIHYDVAEEEFFAADTVDGVAIRPVPTS
jgi:hypothetical protein